MSYDKASRKRIKDKKMRCYTWGGVGKAKTRGAIGFCLDFFGSFCIKTKRTMHKPKVVCKTKKFSNLHRHAKRMLLSRVLPKQNVKESFSAKNTTKASSICSRLLKHGKYTTV